MTEDCSTCFLVVFLGFFKQSHSEYYDVEVKKLIT